MIPSIDFYLDGTVEARLPQLVSKESPLILENKIIDFYRIKSKNPILTYFFVYGSPDSETMIKSPLHKEVQKTLNFIPSSNLSYERCNINPNKILAFKDIMKYLISNSIPFYATITDEAEKEILLGGCNPLEGIKLRNIIKK